MTTTRISRRCISCQRLFVASRSDARACSAVCRVAAQRAGGAKRIMETLRRPLGWWDDVRTHDAKLVDLYSVVLRPSLLIELPPATLKQLEPIDDHGNLGVSIILVHPTPGSDKPSHGASSGGGGVADRVALIKGGRR